MRFQFDFFNDDSKESDFLDMILFPFNSIDPVIIRSLAAYIYQCMNCRQNLF